MDSKIQKTISRLQDRIREGQYYEAHQQLRVVASRYAKQEKWDSAIDILFSGAQSLLKAGQHGSGVDLCLFLVNVYIDAQRRPTSENKGRLLALLRLFPNGEPTRKRFSEEIISWSAKTGEFPNGDPDLHDAVGLLYAQEHDPYDAERHLLLGTQASPQHLADLEYDWYEEDESHTAPLYAARAILPFLVMGNVRGASLSHRRFLERLTEAKSNLGAQEVPSEGSALKIFPSLPLLNFLGLLLQAVSRGRADSYRQLQNHYSAHIKEYGSWDDALDRIGEMYFGIPIRSQTNPLLDMMGSLFGGGGHSKAQPSLMRVEPSEPPTPALD